MHASGTRGRRCRPRSQAQAARPPVDRMFRSRDGSHLVDVDVARDDKGRDRRRETARACHCTDVVTRQAADGALRAAFLDAQSRRGWYSELVKRSSARPRGSLFSSSSSASRSSFRRSTSRAREGAACRTTSASSESAPRAGWSGPWCAPGGVPVAYEDSDPPRRSNSSASAAPSSRVVPSARRRGERCDARRPRGS